MALNVGTQFGHYSVTALIGEGVLGFAEHVLTNAARLWVELGIDGKQDLQQALFPQGLSFDGQGFGNRRNLLGFQAVGGQRRGGIKFGVPKGSFSLYHAGRRDTDSRLSFQWRPKWIRSCDISYT